MGKNSFVCYIMFVILIGFFFIVCGFRYKSLLLLIYIVSYGFSIFNEGLFGIIFLDYLIWWIYVVMIKLIFLFGVIEYVVDEINLVNYIENKIRIINSKWILFKV